MRRDDFNHAVLSAAGLTDSAEDHDEQATADYAVFCFVQAARDVEKLTDEQIEESRRDIEFAFARLQRRLNEAGGYDAH